MTHATFSYEIRMFACPHCGAPLEVPREGGVFQCGYCKHGGEVAVRRDEPSEESTVPDAPVPAPEEPVAERTEEAAPETAPPPDPAEVQRLNQLRQQRDEAVPKHDMSEPENHWYLIGSDLQEGFEALRKHWAEARGSDPDRFFRLTVWLDSLAWDADQQHLCRVALETALEELEDRGYRSILCALLAVDAQASDDPRSADAWLARCDPRSDSLTVDSAYRVACAEIGHARADALGVLRALGTTHEAVPFSEYHEAKATLLRIHVLEHLGRKKDAEDDLRWIKGLRWKQVKQVAEQNPWLAKTTRERTHRKQRNAALLGFGVLVSGIATGVVVGWQVHWAWGIGAGIAALVGFGVVGAVMFISPATNRPYEVPP